MPVEAASLLDDRAHVSALVVGAALVGLASGAAAGGYSAGLVGSMAVVAATLAGVGKSASP